MRKSVILGIFLVNIHSLPAQKLVPADFSFRTLIADSTDSLTSSNNMRSNIVTEIILATDSTVWLGTGLGVSVIRDSLTVETLPSSTELKEGSQDTLLPEGGISAMAASGQGSAMLIAVAGSENDIPVGKGLAYTTNTTDSAGWEYFNQPVDRQVQALFDTVKWSEGDGTLYFAVLPVTVTQANVTYDIAFSDKFAWIASWAGGVRR